MKNMHTNNQRGAVMMIALVMLLILTVLAIGSMRGVALESRITGTRAYTSQLQDAADAALREAEFRFYGPGYLQDKLEHRAANCTKQNEIKANMANKPCLLPIDTSNHADRLALSLDPISFFTTGAGAGLLQHGTGASTDAAGNNETLAWMPYTGLDPDSDSEPQYSAYWNTLLIIAGADENEALNAEYGMVAEGKGTYYYLINGQGDDITALQSTISNIYVGLNN